jgi:hypothetical protein
LPIAAEGLGAGLSAWAWLATAAWVGFMAYFEGYRGFQHGFSPRVVNRAVELSRDPGWLRTALAPLYCMSLFSAERRRLIVSWTLIVMIIGLVVGVSQLDQPARGIIDAGVVVGLGWGLAALLVCAAVRLIGSSSGSP